MRHERSTLHQVTRHQKESVNKHHPLFQHAHADKNQLIIFLSQVSINLPISFLPLNRILAKLPQIIDKGMFTVHYCSVRAAVSDIALERDYNLQELLL